MNSYLYLISSDHRVMRGGANTTPLRSLSASSPRISTPPANAPSTLSSPGGLPSFSTININRTPSPLSDGGDTASEEVAALSNKLIKAINHQTMLDDSLTATRHELEMARAEIAKLKAAAQEHEQAMKNMVERKDMETEHERFLSRIKEERSQRSKAENDKKSIEQELEHLTTALFEEANKVGFGRRSCGDKRTIMFGANTVG